MSRTTRSILVACIFLLAAPWPGARASQGPGIRLLPEAECGPGQAEPCPPADPGQAGGDGLLAPGTPAEPFVLSDPLGQPVLFTPGEGGRPVLLVFWSMFCPPCQEEMPFLAGLSRKLGPRGLRVISINVDGTGMARAVATYARQQKLPFPVAMDEKSDGQFVFARAYGVTGTPTLFLVGPDGRIRWNHEGRTDPGMLQAEIEELLR